MLHCPMRSLVFVVSVECLYRGHAELGQALPRAGSLRLEVEEHVRPEPVHGHQRHVALHTGEREIKRIQTSTREK